MDNYENAMEELKDIVKGISRLRDAAYTQYSVLVEQVLNPLEIEGLRTGESHG